MKRWQAIVLGILVSGGFLALTMWRADLGKMLAAYKNARYGYVIAASLLIVVLTFIRGVRWSVLTQGRLSAVDGFWLFNAGFLFNNVLPARLGEVARAILAGRREGFHFSGALSSIVVERLFDMIALALLIVIVLLALPLPDWATTSGAIMAAGATAGIVVLAITARRPEWALKLGARLLSIVPRIDQQQAYVFLQPFVDGLGGVKDARTFFGGLLLSFLAWAASGITGWILLLAFWRDAPYMMGNLAIAAAGLGIAIPGAPAGVGPYEWAVINALAALEVDTDLARSFAFALHAMNFLGTSILGAIALVREGVSFGQVAEQARTMKGKPEYAVQDGASAES